MGTKREPTARQMRLAVELRRLREAAGISSREAAAMLGVNSVQISQIESGTSAWRLRSARGQLVEVITVFVVVQTAGRPLRDH
ncbi:helix-turn-helix transcriptional regulator, partial [Streptomyces carpinensis]